MGVVAVPDEEEKKLHSVKYIINLLKRFLIPRPFFSLVLYNCKLFDPIQFKFLLNVPGLGVLNFLLLLLIFIVLGWMDGGDRGRVVTAAIMFRGSKNKQSCCDRIEFF